MWEVLCWALELQREKANSLLLESSWMNGDNMKAFGEACSAMIAQKRERLTSHGEGRADFRKGGHFKGVLKDG